MGKAKINIIKSKIGFFDFSKISENKLMILKK